ncbi:Cupin domain protein [Coleofasciculus chthonoplastes PCC 7420]|uniref:Cupin domain protein n=1 Tax=Coleofasciculus chthonoplastes PCC 7420 TaxID=118168 RepID=B4W313_9CYAN|nr:cupin domain-containing protein [Coleofasciculus chthonoplastes]EDX71398.1 Cupin domain protein [Coleofasciculus chthonoplastes PCC 7420]
MTDEQHSLLKASDINSMEAFEFRHPLNPNSEIYLRFLGRAVGLKRIGVTIARVPPGKESFIYHAHQNEEEWVYILSGRGIAEIGDREYEVEPGDFMGFGLPQQPHHLRNPFDEDLVYLIGGEAGRLDIAIFPRMGKRVIRDGESAYIFDESALQLFWSSKQSTED